MGYAMLRTKWKGKKNESLKLKTTPFARQWHHPRKVRTYPSQIIKRSKSSSSRLQKPFHDQNLKCWGKIKNGVISPVVLSMRPYAQIISNHALKGHFIKYAIHFENLLWTYKETIPITKTYSLSHSHVHHKTNNINSSQHAYHIFEYIVKLLYHQVIITTNMNKSKFQHNPIIPLLMTLLKSTCAITKQSTITLLNQVNLSRTITNVQPHITQP